MEEGMKERQEDGKKKEIREKKKKKRKKDPSDLIKCINRLTVVSSVPLS